MATDDELRAAGWVLPTGLDLVANGDNAISQNARRAASDIENARFARLAQPGKSLDGVRVSTLFSYDFAYAGAPTGKPGGMITAAFTDINSAQLVWEFGEDAGLWLRYTGSKGVSEWRRMDAGAINASEIGAAATTQAATPAGFKAVPLALSLGGNGAAFPVASGAVRVPMRWGADISRWRVHIRHVNPRDGVTRPEVTLTGLWLGKRADANGAWSGTPARLLTSGMVPSGGEFVSRWQTIPLAADTDWMLGIGWNAAAVTTSTVGGCWRVPTEDATTGTTTRSPVMPLDVWIEAEVPATTPVLAAFGDSLSSGFAATLPVHDSWLSQWCRANRALPMHLAASGDTMSGWTPTSWKLTRWLTLARPDAIVHYMGSNDIFIDNATLSTMKTRFATTVAMLRAYVTPNIYAATLTPSTQNTTAQEQVRRDYNSWLSSQDVRQLFDFAAAVSTDNETITPAASADGLHLTTGGYGLLAAAVTGVTPPTVAAQIAAARPDTGWRELSSWGADGVITGLPLPAGATPFTNQAGWVRIRRTGDRVRFYLRGLSFSADVVPWKFENGLTSGLTTGSNYSMTALPITANGRIESAYNSISVVKMNGSGIGTVGIVHEFESERPFPESNSWPGKAVA